MKKAIYKVPNGKLLKIALNEDDGVLSEVRITGDFFAYPEETIEKLEKTLPGTPLTESALREKISRFLISNPTQLLGVDAESLVSIILQAHAQ